MNLLGERDDKDDERGEQSASGARLYPGPSDVPQPDGPPPTMPLTARNGWEPPEAPLDADPTSPGPAGVPPGTTPEVAAALGTSESLPPAVGVHTPDVGVGGHDIDTGARPLPGRLDHDRH